MPRHLAVPNSVGAMNRAVSENPLGLGLVIVGAAALAISTFLPFVQPASALRMVEDNTLIQHGGWMLIALALGIAAGGYRASRGRAKEGWMPIVLCAVAAVLILVNANDKGMRTLYPVHPDGTVDTSQPGMVTSLGIAVYVAGAGVAAALIGSLTLLQSTKRAPDPLVATHSDSATKKCPDCAETILLDAKVCKHCGYRFAPVARSSPPSPATKQPTGKPKSPLTDRSSKAAPTRQTPKPTLRPQYDPNRPGGLKGFVQDWKSIPAWQKPPKPQGKAQHKGSPPKADK
jgi:Uncharacterised protein family UPF0547